MPAAMVRDDVGEITFDWGNPGTPGRSYLDGHGEPGQPPRASPNGICAAAHDSYYGYMKEIAAREAKNRFGHLLDAAQSAPVRVTRKGRAVGVMMSVQQYERLRGAAWERLTATMDALGEEATARGLTDARLEALLADES